MQRHLAQHTRKSRSTVDPVKGRPRCPIEKQNKVEGWANLDEALEQASAVRFAAADRTGTQEEEVQPNPSPPRLHRSTEMTTRRRACRRKAAIRNGGQRTGSARGAYHR